MNHEDMNHEESLSSIFEGILKRFEANATQVILTWEAGQREAFERFSQRIDAITRQARAELEKRQQ